MKMSIIHHQFESIHPFYDGNGRTGRIVNILYLIQQGLLDTPILYLSRYITQNKGEYYKCIQNVRETQNWEDWLIFMIKGIEQTSKQTIMLVTEIKNLMTHHKQIIKTKAPKLYSHELLNNLYKYPYTKVEFVAEDCGVSPSTALRKLSDLIELNIVKQIKYGRESFYVNTELFNILSQ